MFVGRAKELSDLSEKLSSNRSEAILVYGRRRVGKTSLVDEALKNTHCKTLKYTFRDVPSSVNIVELEDAIASFKGTPGVSFKDFGSALKYLLSGEKEIVLFLDEYSFLRRDDPGIDSYFQIVFDSFRNKGNIKLIFCGSYMDIMQRMVERLSPLYGRFSLIMFVHPFGYFESSLFAPDLSPEKKFEFYSFFGGSGFVLSSLDFSLSPEENLIRLLIPDSSLFEREAESIIDQEVKKSENAKQVLESIALGRHKYNDINQAFSLHSGAQKNVAYTLKKLAEMDLISKADYINKKQEKNGLYYIKDNLLDFYYSYIFRSTDARSNMAPSDFWKSIEDDVRRSYLPKKFENVAQEFLIRMNRTGKIKPPFSSINHYFYSDKEKKENGEFDLVSMSGSSLTDYECKNIGMKKLA